MTRLPILAAGVFLGTLATFLLLYHRPERREPLTTAWRDLERAAQRMADASKAARESVHPVYPDGPPCSQSCPGPWSSYHEGYADGYEAGRP